MLGLKNCTFQQTPPVPCCPVLWCVVLDPLHAHAQFSGAVASFAVYGPLQLAPLDPTAAADSVAPAAAAAAAARSASAVPSAAEQAAQVQQGPAGRLAAVQAAGQVLANAALEMVAGGEVDGMERMTLHGVEQLRQGRGLTDYTARLLPFC